MLGAEAHEERQRRLLATQMAGIVVSEVVSQIRGQRYGAARLVSIAPAQLERIGRIEDVVRGQVVSWHGDTRSHGDESPRVSIVAAGVAQRVRGMACSRRSGREAPAHLALQEVKAHVGLAQIAVGVVNELAAKHDGPTLLSDGHGEDRPEVDDAVHDRADELVCLVVGDLLRTRIEAEARAELEREIDGSDEPVDMSQWRRDEAPKTEAVARYAVGNARIVRLEPILIRNAMPLAMRDGPRYGNVSAGTSALDIRTRAEQPAAREARSNRLRRGTRHGHEKR